MKNTFLIIMTLLLLNSCDLIDAFDGCDEPEVMELTENDQRWIPKDTVMYFAINQDTFALPSDSHLISYEPESVTDCKTPIGYSKSLATKYIPNANISIYTDIGRGAKYANISYTFAKYDSNSLVVGRSQLMGMIDLNTNEPVDLSRPSRAIHSEYLGNHTIRGREYTEVYRFTDLNERNVPEIDVASIIVSPIGFLRIEFYDGEVWERVIVE